MHGRNPLPLLRYIRGVSVNQNITIISDDTCMGGTPYDVI